MQELKVGSKLQNGKYRIDKVLGRGGCGITYQGETVTTISGKLGIMDVKVKIAIKEFFLRDRCVRHHKGLSVIVPDEGNYHIVDKYKNKFISEARKLSEIHHPNIINVSDVFEENSTVYYVMQYLGGGSMADIVKQTDVGRLSEEEALKYIHQIGDALSYLHSKKHMCHLDVKPANVLLSEDGKAILIDFGISKTWDDTGNGESSTSSVSYSNNYAPLEQYQSLKQFSPETDLYSLGATFFYMLTGNTPPEASELLDGFPKCPYYINNAHLWRALELAMQPRKKDRPETVAKWFNILDGKESFPVPVEAVKPVAQPVMSTDDETIVGEGGKLDIVNEKTTVTNNNVIEDNKKDALKKYFNRIFILFAFIVFVVLTGYIFFNLLGSKKEMPDKMVGSQNTKESDRIEFNKSNTKEELGTTTPFPSRQAVPKNSVTARHEQVERTDREYNELLQNEKRRQQKRIEKEKAEKAKKEKEEAKEVQRKAKEAAEKAAQATQQAAEKAKAAAEKDAASKTTLHVGDNGNVKVDKPATQGQSESPAKSAKPTGKPLKGSTKE